MSKCYPTGQKLAFTLIWAALAYKWQSLAASATAIVMDSPETLSLCISELNRQGYVADLNRPDASIWREPGAFDIDAVYRFEGLTDPADQAILYAITSDKFGIKGVLVNGYGLSADTPTADLAQQLIS